jgi:hypothetical protein
MYAQPSGCATIFFNALYCTYVDNKKVYKAFLFFSCFVLAKTKIVSYFPSANPYAMTLLEFSKLDELEQIEHFWDGALIGERRDGDFVIQCRQIDGFYVEYKIMGGYYLDMWIFTNPDHLAPYLNGIDIRSLLP